MIHVLYTEDFEPLTVIDVHPQTMDMMKAGKTIVFQIPNKIQEELKNSRGENFVEMKPIRIWTESFFWFDGSQKEILMTDGIESSLLLKPYWLPGQQATIQAYKKTIKQLKERE